MVTQREAAHARECGAVLVEAALITPIALALVFGTMELGYAYYGKLTVEHMSIAGARTASGYANDYSQRLRHAPGGEGRQDRHGGELDHQDRGLPRHQSQRPRPDRV